MAAIDRPATDHPVVKAVTNRVKRAGEGLAEFGHFISEFVAYASLRAFTDIVLRLRYRHIVAHHISDIVVGVGALVVGGGMVFVIVSMALFTGFEVGLQGYQGLSQIGAEQYAGIAASFAVTREIAPVVAAVALAAQIGTSFTAEIGAMRVNDEIDAMDVIGINSVIYLVSTRVVAVLIVLLPLYLIALFSSFFASRFITTAVFGLSPGVYDYYFNLYLPPIDVLYSVIKVCVFAMLITFVHCYFGYYAHGGPVGVGRAVGTAVRTSISMVVIINLFLSFVFWGAGNTVSIVG